jgi:hypothetical protein
LLPSRARLGHPSFVQTERRANHRTIPDESMTRALAAAAQRDGALAAVLATEDGLLVAGTGAGYDLSVLAAFAPFVGNRRASEHAALQEVTQGQPFQAAAIRVNGMQVFFATLGDSLGDVARIEAAAGRIFAA